MSLPEYERGQRWELILDTGIRSLSQLHHFTFSGNYDLETRSLAFSDSKDPRLMVSGTGVR